MDSWKRLKFAAAAAGVVAVVVGVHQVTDLVFRDTYVAKPGYKVPGVSEPAVDLVSLQRSWPGGLSAEGGRANVREYMSNIESVSLPSSVEIGPVRAPAAPELDLGARLAAASAEQGRQTASVCASCHTFDRGGPDRIGPSLWGVVGRRVASRPAFSYSSAFAAQTGEWTYERLDHYLTNPAKAVPGNRMGFAGLRRAQDRANVIAFLSTMSGGSPPFPKPEGASVTQAPP